MDPDGRCPKGGVVTIGQAFLHDECDVTCTKCGTVGSDLIVKAEASELATEHQENGVLLRFGERIWEDSFEPDDAKPEDLKDRYLRLVAIVRRIQRETKASVESAHGHTLDGPEDGSQLAWIEGRGFEWEYERRIDLTDSEATLWVEVTGTGQEHG